MPRAHRRMIMKSVVAVLAALALPLALSGCGTADVAAGDPAEHQYDGPLHVDPAEATHPRAGAAGNVVDCDTWGAGGSSGDGTYDEGATADSPAEALEVARSERLYGGVQHGLLVAKQEEDRVLYVVEVGGVVKGAVIVHDGPATEGAGGDGWYVESWATCDYSELPRSFTDSIGLQIWTDTAGRPMPTATIQAWLGPEHCDWQSMTFLQIGGADYVRRPQPGLEEFFDSGYVAHLRLPADAVATGYEHDGDRLWLAADKGAAYVGTRDDVEAWPRAVRRLGCE